MSVWMNLKNSIPSKEKQDTRSIRCIIHLHEILEWTKLIIHGDRKQIIVVGTFTEMGHKGDFCGDEAVLGLNNGMG